MIQFDTIYVFLSGFFAGYVFGLPTANIVTSTANAFRSIFSTVHIVDERTKTIETDVSYLRDRMDEVLKEKHLTDTSSSESSTEELDDSLDSDDELDRIFDRASLNLLSVRTIHDVVKDIMNTIDYDPDVRVSKEDEKLVLSTLKDEVEGVSLKEAKRILNSYGFGMRVLYINNGPLIVEDNNKYNALTIGVKVRDRGYHYLKKIFSEEAVIFKLLDVGGVDPSKKGGRLDDL